MFIGYDIGCMPKGQKIDWSILDPLLGTKTDREIAQQTGISLTGISSRRYKIKRESCTLPQKTNEDHQLEANGKRRCRGCREIKDLVDFGWNKGSGARICRECSLKTLRQKRIATKQWSVDLLGGECQHCGYKEHLAPLQFHHVGSDKEIGISFLFNQPRKRNKLVEELSKCCLLCSNCHDAFHGNELALTFVKREHGFTVLETTL